MSETESSPPPSAAEAFAAAVHRAEAALADLKAAIDKGEVGELSHKVAAAATTLLREGEHLIEQNEALRGARRELSGAIRKHPLAAIGAAFGAGLLVALLARG